MYVDVSPEETTSSNSMDSLDDPNRSLKHSWTSISRNDFIYLINLTARAYYICDTNLRPNDAMDRLVWCAADSAYGINLLRWLRVTFITRADAFHYWGHLSDNSHCLVMEIKLAVMQLQPVPNNPSFRNLLRELVQQDIVYSHVFVHPHYPMHWVQ